MKNRLAEVSHHAVEGLQREQRGRAFILGAGSSLLKQRCSCLVPPHNIPSMSHGRTITRKSPRRRCSGASLGERAPPDLKSCPLKSPRGTGWGCGHCFCLRRWEGTVRVTCCGPPVLTWLLRSGAPYCKPASPWGKWRKRPGQAFCNCALQCHHVPSPLSGHWPHTVVTKAGLLGQKGSKNFQRTQNTLPPPAPLPKAADWHAVS